MFRIRALSRDIQKAQETIGGDYQWTQADVTQPETLIMALQDSDIIISTIGAKPGKGPDGPESVVYKGVINLVDEAKRAGTQHIIYMSSIGAGGSEHFSTVFLNLFMNKTMKWKSLGEEYIRNSGIDFTIVRPGGLYGDPGTQGIKFDQGDKIIGSIPRGDVASVLVESVYNPDAINKTFEIINNESLPVDAWKDEFKSLKNWRIRENSIRQITIQLLGFDADFRVTDRSIDSPTQKKKESGLKNSFISKFFLFLLHFYPTIQKVLHRCVH